METDPRLHDQRGVTLIELIVTLAVFLVVSFGVLTLLRAFARGTQMVATATGGALSIEQQIDVFRSEAATAFAVFVPSADVFKASNADGHELDFYSKTDDGRPVFWAYRYDASKRELRRYDYDLLGRYGVADRATGTIAQGQSYPPITKIAGFTAHRIFADQLVDRTKNTYAAIIAPLFTSATPKPLPVGFDDGGAQRDDLYGGNMTIEVALASDRGSRIVHLATGALPSGFTVHANPKFRVVIYREDHSNRHFLDVVSRIYIGAQLLVSYDDFKTTIKWCDYKIFGNPDGLQQPIRNGVDHYHPEWYIESTAGVLYAVTHGHTNGNPCPRTPPLPVGFPMAHYSPPPQVTDTPGPS